MYFTSTPALNSMEAIMKQPPGGNQRGGGRLRGAYPFNKADCDCRLCLYYRKKKGCSMEVCPVLNIRLSCGAASLHEAVHAAFADARHIPFQRRLSHLYDRKDDAPMIFQTDQHNQRFEAAEIAPAKAGSSQPCCAVSSDCGPHLVVQDKAILFQLWRSRSAGSTPRRCVHRLLCYLESGQGIADRPAADLAV